MTYIANTDACVKPGIGHNSSRNQHVFRSNPETGYTKISNGLLQNGDLSYEARGLMGELLSRPDDWEITIAAIVASGTAGRDKVYRIVRELEAAGYAKNRRERRPDGTLDKSCYAVSDDPKLLFERTTRELSAYLTPLPGNPEVVFPLPENQEVEKVVAQQSTSWKSASTQPLPGKPDLAKPLPENPHHTKERELQKKEITNPPRAHTRDGHLAKVASAVAATFASALPLAASPHLVEQISEAPAECWQTPKATQAAVLNPTEAKLQRQVWVTSTGRVEVAGDFKAELEREFPLVDLKCGLATAGPNVQPDRGAIHCSQTIRREFGYMQQREKKAAERAASYAKPAVKEFSYVSPTGVIRGRA